MKRCPYCGKEYPDEVVKCFIDGHSLPEIVCRPPSSKKQPNVPCQALDSAGAVPDSKPERKHEPVLTYPDYQWSARDAWKCLGMCLVIWFVWYTSISGMGRVRAFHAWHRSGIGFLSMTSVRYTLFLLTAAYFARTEKLASFLRGFGLDRKPSPRAWFGIAMALIIRGFGHLIIISGLSKGVSNYDLNAFRNTIGNERYLFLVPLVLLAPVFEETIYRGFIYIAFRNSYPLWASMALVVAWTANTHWQQYSASWVAAFDLSVITIVQCYLREKSDSIWDCISCHFAFNASLLFVGHVFR